MNYVGQRNTVLRGDVVAGAALCLGASRWSPRVLPERDLGKLCSSVSSGNPLYCKMFAGQDLSAPKKIITIV